MIHVMCLTLCFGGWQRLWQLVWHITPKGYHWRSAGVFHIYIHYVCGYITYVFRMWLVNCFWNVTEWDRQGMSDFFFPLIELFLWVILSTVRLKFIKPLENVISKYCIVSFNAIFRRLESVVLPCVRTRETSLSLQLIVSQRLSFHWS